MVSPGQHNVRDEADLQARIAQLATRCYGLLHYHTHDSRRSACGFPDSVFVGSAVVFRELKMTRRSRVGPDQRIWIDRLQAAGADAGIWYAQDYYSGAVDTELRAIAGPTTIAGASINDSPPMVMRLAKRLYIKADDNPARAALLWEAGAEPAEHGRWIARAQEILAIVAAELPAGQQQYQQWVATSDPIDRHMPGVQGGAAMLAAIKSMLTAPAGTIPGPRPQTRPGTR